MRQVGDGMKRVRSEMGEIEERSGGGLVLKVLMSLEMRSWRSQAAEGVVSKATLIYTFHQETTSQRWGWRASSLLCGTRCSSPSPRLHRRAQWGCYGCPWQ
jgi:hypothetical protein